MPDKDKNKRPPGRPVQGEAIADTILHIRLTSKQKARYVASSQRKGLKLSAWALDILDDHAWFDDEM